MNETKIEQENREKEAQRRMIYNLRQEWNAPALHAKNQSVFTGPWGEAYGKVRAKLGHGATMAIVGIRGNGKTQMGVEAMRKATAGLKRAYYITAAAFFLRIRATYSKDVPETEIDVINALIRPTLLVIDELSKRSEKEWENQMLCHLIGERYNAMKDTILISNQSQADFDASLDDSIIRRLNDTGGVIVADWPPVGKEVV